MDLSIFLIQEAMAKDGFVIYKSFYAPIQSLSDESLGKLFRAIFEYQIHGVCVELPVELTMAFNFFKTKFESDNIKYEAIVERNKANGRKGGRPSKEDDDNETIENPENPMGFKEPKKADKDMDKEGNRGDKENNKKEEKDKSFSKKEHIDYNAIVKCWNETNPTLSNVKMLNNKRKEQIRTLLASNNATVDDLMKAIKIISMSSFCQGKNDRNWRASFDWLIKDTKSCFSRLFEGAYAFTQDEKNKLRQYLGQTANGGNPTLPKGWEQERYDMYIRNGYTITEDGRLFRDGREIK